MHFILMQIVNDLPDGQMQFETFLGSTLRGGASTEKDYLTIETFEIANSMTFN